MTKTPLLLAALAVLLVACNRGETGNTTTTPSSGGAASGSGKLKIVFIPKNTGNVYFDEIDRGFKAAQQELGFDYSEVGPEKGDPTSQIPIVKDQIQRHVDVIAIAANDKDALVPVLDQAKSQGITVITVDSDISGNESHRDAAVLQADFNKVGADQLELMGSLIGYKGDFAILSATANAPNQNAWIATINQDLKDPKYAGMHLVATVYGDDKSEKSTTECEGLVSKYPNLRGIIAPTSVGMAAAAQVVERMGVFPGGPHAVGQGLQLTGLSTPNQLKKFVQAGEVGKFQLWAPFNEGYVAAYLGSQIHTGKLKPAAGAVLETKQIKTPPMTAKDEVIAGDIVTFDKSNIDKFNF